MIKHSIEFIRRDVIDDITSPMDYLFQDPTYKEEDQAYLDAYNNESWHYIGIKAKATIVIASYSGEQATIYTVTSPGLWGIVSNGDEKYHNEVYEDQKQQLIADLKKFPLALEGL